MVSGQVIKYIVLFSLFCVGALLIGSLQNRITVYRDYADLCKSALFVVAPISSALLIGFVADSNTSVLEFATGNLMGKLILLGTSGLMIWSICSAYSSGITDNGTYIGVFVGTGKLIIAAIVAFSALSLVRYLFREDRKIGHIAIFFILLSVLGWLVASLVKENTFSTELDKRLT